MRRVDSHSISSCLGIPSLLISKMTDTRVAVPVEYLELASAGTSRATEAGRSSAKVQFNQFCAKKVIGISPQTQKASIDLLSEDELCSEKLFREFSTYLLENATNSKNANRDYLMSRTAIQYLSAIKEFAQKKFPQNALWEVRCLDRWYPSLRVALEKKVNRRQIVNGQPVSESSQAIGRNLLITISEVLMRDGRMEAMKRRLAINMTFLAVGRAGEAACSTWSSVVWDYELGNLLMDWSEIKTGDSDPMNFFSDKSSMAIDFYHSLACYLALGGGNAKLSQTSDCNWIMPDLARNAESAASLVTKYVREALSQCDDETIAQSSRDYEGTSLRYVY